MIEWVKRTTSELQSWPGHFWSWPITRTHCHALCFHFDADILMCIGLFSDWVYISALKNFPVDKLTSTLSDHQA